MRSRLALASLETYLGRRQGLPPSRIPGSSSRQLAFPLRCLLGSKRASVTEQLLLSLAPRAARKRPVPPNAGLRSRAERARVQLLAPPLRPTVEKLTRFHLHALDVVHAIWVRRCAPRTTPHLLLSEAGRDVAMSRCRDGWDGTMEENTRIICREHLASFSRQMRSREMRRERVRGERAHLPARVDRTAGEHREASACFC